MEHDNITLYSHQAEKQGEGRKARKIGQKMVKAQAKEKKSTKQLHMK